jgi:hypothetical protein
VGGCLEGGQDDADRDPEVSGDRQGVAGVVVEPAEDLDGDAVGELPVREVGLPGLVGLLGLEADVGRLRLFLRLRGDHAGDAEVAVDRGRGRGQLDVVVVFEVPGDRVATRVTALRGETVAELEDQLDRRCRGLVRAGVWSPRAGLERQLAFGVIAGDEFGDPAFGDAVVTGHLGLRASFEHDSSDDQTSFRHPRASPHRVSHVATDAFPMS